jgi:hypothetical protein
MEPVNQTSAVTSEDVEFESDVTFESGHETVEATVKIDEEAKSTGFTVAKKVQLSDSGLAQPLPIQRILKSAILYSHKLDKLRVRFERQVIKLHGPNIDAAQMWSDLIS